MEPSEPSGQRRGNLGEGNGKKMAAAEIKNIRFDRADGTPIASLLLKAATRKGFGGEAAGLKLVPLD